MYKSCIYFYFFAIFQVNSALSAQKWPEQPVKFPSLGENQTYCPHQSNLAVRFYINFGPIKKGEIFRVPSLGGLFFVNAESFKGFNNYGRAGNKILYIHPDHQLHALQNIVSGSVGGLVKDKKIGVGFVFIFTNKDQICKYFSNYK